ncbi:tetratricopeptide repeat protein [Streptomyces sp. NBC_01476]|uniref:tetratricopeptide repeat protein n=1 Tax=Streptomyces sp. NBC_01476 TaxID=2903881 RepID=UPI002E3692BB|nr:tetratricopeptide repeat protein [Streptomyces sp. NBC_01476]
MAAEPSGLMVPPPSHEALTDLQLGQIALEAGDWKNALQLLQRARDLFAIEGSSPLAALASHQVARTLALAGRTEEAQAQAEIAIAAFETAGDGKEAERSRSLAAEIKKQKGPQSDSSLISVCGAE